MTKTVDRDPKAATSDTEPRDNAAAGRDTAGATGRWRTWSRLAAVAAPFSDWSRGVQERLAAAPPTHVGTAEQTAAIPRRPPAIPGVVDLVPWARGGMGIVYRGRDVALDRPVAVKAVWFSGGDSDRARERARREAHVLARISHPHVVTVYAAGDIEGSPYLVMEWVDGPSLEDQLRHGLPSPRQAARIVRDLASAVAVVHDFGIIHRDIKPANVLLAGQAAFEWERSSPKLADFGLARPTEGLPGITQDAAALGTPAYMAPEQTGLAENLGAIGRAVDIHGLGGLAFALVTGGPPYDAPNPTASLHRAARGDRVGTPAFRRVPRELRAIIEKALDRQPGRRYATAGDLAADLDRFLAGRPVQARPLSPLARLRRASVRQPVRSAAIGLAGALVATVIGGFAWHSATIARARAAAVLTAARAEEAAAAAERSMDHLTGDLIEKMVLRSSPDDASHIRFLQSLREEFSNWPLGSDQEAGLRFRLRGLRRVADLFYEISRHDDAVACHRLSLAVLDELSALRPDGAEGVRERLTSMRAARSSLYHLGRNEEAEVLARKAIALLDDAPAGMPGKELARIEHALDLGIVLHEQGRIDEGKEQIDVALAGFRRLREARPEDVDLAARETHALFSSQLSLSKAGRFAECRQQLEQLVGVSGGFLATHPADAIPLPQRSMMTKLVGIGHAQLGRLAADEGHLDEAIAHVLRQRDLCAAFLADLPPGRIDPVHDALVDAELHAATLLEQAGREQEARAAVGRAEATGRMILEDQPGVWDHAALMGGILWRRGEFARQHGDLQTAAARYREIVTLLEPWRDTPACREKTAILLQTAEAALAHCLVK